MTLFMTYLDTIILGIIEGVTEFLPVSSTGHLILASHLLGIPDGGFTATFNIAIQLGAIAAVTLLYFKDLLRIPVLTRLLVAFIPTGIIGFLLYKIIKTYFLGNELLVVTMLALGGVALIVFELFYKEKPDAPVDVTSITYTQSFIIGLCQSLAMVPGVSRSAATIVGGLLMGIRRTAIVEFSFLLAVPTMVAATGYDLLKSYDTLTFDNLGLLLSGFLTAFVVALLAMRFLLAYVRKYSFLPFGIYRILLAALFFGIVLL